MKLIIQFLEQVENFNFKEFILKEKRLAFLVGAGISCEPPSLVASTKEIKEGIIKFGIPEERQDSILSMKELRFEDLIESFKEKIDLKLEFLKYFESFKDFNLIHKFLADMIFNKHVVMTTNFDNLIEHAMGLEKNNIRIIITNEDYEKHEDPEKLFKDKMLPLYKLHGSLKNSITEENTRDSIILTLQSLGKQMGGALYSIGKFKERFMKLACKNRTLIILGYSGRDDLDIIPTILRMKKMRRLIWISHNPDIHGKSIIYRVNPNAKLELKSISKLSDEDLLIYKISTFFEIEVLKIEVYTLDLIMACLNRTSEEIGFNKNSKSQPFLNWLENNLEKPAIPLKYMFAAKIFIDHNYFNRAINCFKKAHKYYELIGDREGMAFSLHGLGAAYNGKLDDKKAKMYYSKAYNIFKELGNEEYIVFMLSSFGALYNEIKKPLKALKFHKYALKYYEKNVRKKDIAIQLYNIGVVHERIGDNENNREEYQLAFEYYQKARAIFEELGELSRIAHILYSISLEQERLLKYQEAIMNSKHSYDLYEKCGLLEGQLLVSYDLGRYYYKVNNLTEAKNWFQLSIKACLLKRDRIQYPILLIKIGRMIRRFDVKMAIELYLQADKWSKINKDELGIAMIGNELGELYSNQGKFDLAEKYFTRALSIAKKRKDQRSIPELQEKILSTKVKYRLPIVK